MRPWFGQSVSTTTSNVPGARRQHLPALGARAGSRATSGTGCGPAVASPASPPSPAPARAPSSVPSTSASGWTWPSISAAPRGRASRSRSAAAAPARRPVTLSPRTRPVVGSGSAGPRGATGYGRRAPWSGRAGTSSSGVTRRSRWLAQPVPARSPARSRARRARRPTAASAPSTETKTLAHLQILASSTSVTVTKPEPRVLELALQERGDLLLDELVHAIEPLALHVSRISTTGSR